MKYKYTLGLLLVLCACSTKYQSSGFGGGYEDFETQPGVYYISFRGNGFTKKAEVVRGFHRRAEEICGGPTKYELISSSSETNSREVDINQNNHQEKNKNQFVASPKITIRKSTVEGYVRCIK